MEIYFEKCTSKIEKMISLYYTHYCLYTLGQQYWIRYYKQHNYSDPINKMLNMKLLTILETDSNLGDNKYFYKYHDLLEKGEGWKLRELERLIKMGKPISKAFENI